MKKKDREIEKRLHEYADRERPTQRLVMPAAELMRENVEKSKKKRKTYLKVGFSFAAVLIVIIVSAAVVLPSLTGRNAPKSDGVIDKPATPSYYAIDKLSAKKVTAAELEAELQAGLDIFPDVSTDYEARYTLYYFTDSEEAAFAVCTTRRLGEGGPEDVVLIVEFSSDICNEFKEFHSLGQQASAGNTYLGKTVFQGGEYVSYAYIEGTDVRYYLSLTRPTNTGLDDYLSAIFEKIEK